jgi:hypothetical protein
MRKRETTVRLGTKKPRNFVIRAMLSLVIRGAKHGGHGRQRDRDRRELDQLVRESGEW